MSVFGLRGTLVGSSHVCRKKNYSKYLAQQGPDKRPQYVDGVGHSSEVEHLPSPGEAWVHLQHCKKKKERKEKKENKTMYRLAFIFFSL